MAPSETDNGAREVLREAVAYTDRALRQLVVARATNNPRLAKMEAAYRGLKNCVDAALDFIIIAAAAEAIERRTGHALTGSEREKLTDHLMREGLIGACRQTVIESEAASDAPAWRQARETLRRDPFAPLPAEIVL